MESDDISLLEEKMIQILVRSSLLVLESCPSLIYSVWTKKNCNPDSFRAQMKCIWKTKRKFDIRVVWKNLFIIEFDDVDDLEPILEGRPRLFRKQMVNIERFSESIERSKI